MRIAISAAQSTGKTQLIEVFKQYWPMYVTPAKTYRDLIKDKNLSINEKGNLESQKIIRDALIDQAIDNSGEKYIIHDRCILDSLAYSLWMAESGLLENADISRGRVSDFIAETLLLSRETIKLYDVIFYLPVDPEQPINDKENRSNDEKYRLEMDEIFYGLYDAYRTGDDSIFDFNKNNDKNNLGTPPIIELPYKLQDRIDLLKMYINDNGDLLETEKSVLSDIAEMELPNSLLKQVKGKRK